MEQVDFGDLFFDPDAFSKVRSAEVPEPIRKIVEQHVAARLPAKVLAKLRDLHARGISIGSDDAFYHFGGVLPSETFAEIGSMIGIWQPAGLGGDWDNCYIGVLAAVAAAPVRAAKATVTAFRQTEFSFVEPSP
jgi:hypothetical protein